MLYDVLDASRTRIMRWLGSFGAAHVTLRDSTGAAHDEANPIPVAIADASVTMEVTVEPSVEISVTASDGEKIEIDAQDISIVYSGDNVDYMSVTVGAVEYRQTYTYVGTQVTAISKWTAQP